MPKVSGVTVVANPNNVLSAIVTSSVEGVDSARVRFFAADGDSGATPFARHRHTPSPSSAWDRPARTRVCPPFRAARLCARENAKTPRTAMSPSGEATRGLRLTADDPEGTGLSVGSFRHPQAFSDVGDQLRWRVGQRDN